MSFRWSFSPQQQSRVPYFVIRLLYVIDTHRDTWRRPGYGHCRYQPKFYTQSEMEIEWGKKKENIIKKKQAPTTQNSTLSQIDFRVSMATNGPRWPETSGAIDAGRDELTASAERRKYRLFSLSRTREVPSLVFVSFCQLISPLKICLPHFWSSLHQVILSTPNPRHFANQPVTSQIELPLYIAPGARGLKLT